jgi:hypothetical protein
MPLYEFYCPDDPTFRMERRVSQFAIVGRAREDAGDDPFAGMDENKVEALMADMERSMAGMDDSHPDPKQLGQMMRKMTDLMGDKTPEALREMVSRLEAGEDPDKLEEQYGHLAEGYEPNSAEGHAADTLWDNVQKKLRHLRKGPFRDPKFYDMADYV